MTFLGVFSFYGKKESMDCVETLVGESTISYLFKDHRNGFSHEFTIEVKGERDEYYGKIWKTVNVSGIGCGL